MNRRSLAIAVIAATLAVGGSLLYSEPRLPTAAETAAPVTSSPSTESHQVTSLGRIEPKDGVIRVAGPSTPSVVAKLFVEEGDPVRQGELVAITDNWAIWKARVESYQAELNTALKHARRLETLNRERVVADDVLEEQELKVNQARADLEQARAELEHTTVHAPISGHVLRLYARAGERVGPQGIAELGKTGQMCAVAEVYETDIGRIRLGQRARIGSPALAHDLHGTVDRIGLEIGKQEVLNVDPTAQTDARVVEVEILLDESAQAAALTRLQVQIAIDTAGGEPQQSAIPLQARVPKSNTGEVPAPN